MRPWTISAASTTPKPRRPRTTSPWACSTRYPCSGRRVRHDPGGPRLLDRAFQPRYHRGHQPAGGAQGRPHRSAGHRRPRRRHPHHARHRPHRRARTGYSFPSAGHQKPVPLVPRALIREIDERIDCMGRRGGAAGRGGGRGGHQSLGGRAGRHRHRHSLPVVVQEPGPRIAGPGDRPAGRSRRLRLLLASGGPAHGRVRAHGGHRHQQLRSPGIGCLLPAGCRPPSRHRPAGIRCSSCRCPAGYCRPTKAVETPLTALGSGPVGGIIGSLSLARQLGHKNIIATDMGGTSFEVGLIIDGEPLVGDEKIIDQYRYRLPQLQTTSIACGGGSLARFDPLQPFHPGGPGERRRRTRTGLLPAGRHRAHRDRRRPGTGAAVAGELPRRPHAAGPRGPLSTRSQGWASRSG